MRHTPVRREKPCRLLMPPHPSVPDATLMQRRLLGSLLIGVVASLAEGLQVVLIPEQASITAVRYLVIAHQQRGVAFELAASAALVQVTKEDREAQRSPSGCLVPSAPRRCGPATV
jgi:hypothetical protein